MIPKDFLFINYSCLIATFTNRQLVGIVLKKPRFWNNYIALISPRGSIYFIYLSGLRWMETDGNHVTDVIKISLLYIKLPFGYLFAFKNYTTFRLSTSLLLRLFKDLLLLGNLKFLKGDSLLDRLCFLTKLS